MAAMVPMSARAADVASIKAGIKSLRGLPVSTRGAKTGELAHDIAALPAGTDKMTLALTLSHLATEGDPGRDNLQAVTDTLAQAAKDTPAGAVKPEVISGAYEELASLARYEGMRVSPDTSGNAQFKSATDKLVANDKDVEAADFTLQDAKGKKWNLRSLRGKILVVNFWATWCPPCRVELPALDAIASKYAAQDVVVLAITDEDIAKVNSVLPMDKLHFTVLFDPNHKAATAFHVDGLPKTVFFNREGKVAAEAMDGRTPQQFMGMLQKAGVKL